MDQESITIDISVEKKCVMIPLNSNPLNAWIQIIEHLLRLIKVVITGENGFYMLYLSGSYSTQQKQTQQWKDNNNEHYSRRSNRQSGRYE